ncbi:MAG: hypothetical protein FIA95_02690 [Gemmatimonadetes bacterium]|nr:hypothetical protein [Gemmatimonadota bacterium]
MRAGSRLEPAGDGTGGAVERYVSRMSRSFRWCAIPAAAAACLVLPALPSAASAQDPSALGTAIAKVCGQVVDPATQGVLAGVVTDSLSGIPLRGARAKIVWQAPGDAMARTAEVGADKDGLFAFCAVPADVVVLLSATLGKTSPAIAVPIEAGMLHVESIRLPLSDPGKTGMLVGRVVDAESRAPVDGVAVRLAEEGTTVLTNERGYFSLGEREAGVHYVALERLGYTPREVPIHVAGNLTQAVEIELSQQAIPLEGISVSVAPRRTRQDLEGLIRRMSLGFGSFITRETLERRGDVPLSEYLREVPGVLVFRDGPRAYLEVRGNTCNPDVYMDGQIYPLDPAAGLNELFARPLEAIEIFKGTETPAEFIRPGFRYPCAVILVWTRPGD